MHADDMNKLLRGELSAIETYQQALEKERAAFGQGTEFQQLSSILRDHQQAADRLKTEIQRQGGTRCRRLRRLGYVVEDRHGNGQTLRR